MNSAVQRARATHLAHHLPSANGIDPERTALDRGRGGLQAAQRDSDGHESHDGSPDEEDPLPFFRWLAFDVQIGARRSGENDVRRPPGHISAHPESIDGNGMIVPSPGFHKYMICSDLQKRRKCANTPDTSEIEKLRPIIEHFRKGSLSETVGVIDTRCHRFIGRIHP